MMSVAKSYEALILENIELQARLDEAEETLRAIHYGEIDAIVVASAHGNQVYTLQNADQPYRLFIEEIQQGAATISTDGIILYCNKYFADMLNSSLETLISYPIERWIVTSERQSFRAFIQTAKAKNGIYHEFSFQIQANEVIPGYIAATLLTVDQLQVICLVVTDLRERKKSEHQAIELAVEKQHTQLLRNFVRDTSHDLRTPITVALSVLDSLKYIQDEAKKLQKIEKAERHIHYLHRVLEQFQQMSLLDEYTDLPLRVGRINSVILENLTFFQKQANDKGISISADIAPNTSLVKFDPDTLYRAIHELIRNALQFSSPNGYIYLRSDSVNEGQLLIEIEDNGIGIAPHDLPNIFERFYKADKSRNISASSGAGLGLAIVKRIIELHHGVIEVESISGKTKFRIRLPTVDS